MNSRAHMSWAMGSTFFVYLAIQILTGCTHTPNHVDGSHAVARDTAAVFEPAMIYYSYDDNLQPHPEVMTASAWQHAGEGHRYDYLVKLYYANVREKSLTGQLHAGCFVGYAQEVQNTFFNPEHSPPIRDIELKGLKARASSDQLALGLRFTGLKNNGSKEKMEYIFRFPNCQAGKMPMGPELGLPVKKAMNSTPGYGHVYAMASQPGRHPAQTTPLETLRRGFEILDSLSPADQAEAKRKNLPEFKLSADYEKAAKRPDEDKTFPWRKKKFNVRDEKDALELALILQKYFYEGMANQNSSNKDQNFLASAGERAGRYWCNMPWQNEGPAGREIVHGLTKERDMMPSPTMLDFLNPTPGSDWGVAYYNKPACRSIQKVFGSRSKMKEPDWSQAKYEDGSLSAKILFTTADFEQIRGAYVWNANLSGPGENDRKLRDARHIQMDIAIKDPSFQGTREGMFHWIMFTYYFDRNYDYDTDYKAKLGIDNPLTSITPKIPAELLKMRPLGIQYGVAADESIIFKNAANTVFSNSKTGRLNGPADNPKSSCLSCHAAAGTVEPISPGFMSESDFQAKMAGNLDFGQQFALAKRNLETNMATDKKAPAK